MSWEDEFRNQFKRFEASSFAKSKGLFLSIKVYTMGCYHREHSPNAYRLIDEYLQSHNSTEFTFQEHEHGPELFVYLGTAISLTVSVINLVVAIINARSEGIKRGDRRGGHLSFIIRGFDENGNLKEEKVLRIDSNDSVTKELIGKALNYSLNKFVPSNVKGNKTRRTIHQKY